MSTTNAPERWTEDFEIFTHREEDLTDEVSVMEANSIWLEGNISRNLELIGIPAPLEASLTAQKYGLDEERTLENSHGLSYRSPTPDNSVRSTGLILQFQTLDKKKGIVDQYKNISRAAWGTLCETAKLNGSALGRMEPLQLADCLNGGLDVARGQTLLLIRHDKVMAMHSDAECGYCVMPISKLLELSRQALEDKFGAVCFKEGRHSNVYTTALWTLPDVQKSIIAKYRMALANAVSNLHQINFMPAVRFSASDTARSSAILRPVFVKPDGTTLAFGGEIAVKHEKKRRGTFGLDLFEEQAGTLFAKFNETVEIIEKMAETEIVNPVNCVVGILNHLNRGNSVIKRQYADAAREEVEQFSISCPIMSMHDIYLSLSECVSAARKAGVQNTAKIEEALAKVLTMNWKDFDVGGIVAWGEKGAA